MCRAAVLGSRAVRGPWRRPRWPRVPPGTGSATVSCRATAAAPRGRGRTAAPGYPLGRRAPCLQPGRKPEGPAHQGACVCGRWAAGGSSCLISEDVPTFAPWPPESQSKMPARSGLTGTCGPGVERPVPTAEVQLGTGHRAFRKRPHTRNVSSHSSSAGQPGVPNQSEDQFSCRSETPWIGVCQTTLQEDAVWVISSVCEISQI